jgi:DNA-binding CsgD family transcriptional regulator
VGPWGFVGRTDELRRVSDAAAGLSGRGLIVSGTAGIGKTRLLREGVAALSRERFAVLTASANAATAGLPFGGLAQVLPVDQPVGLSPAGLLRWAVESLHQQAAGRPIVFAIDDAHLLDPVSATLVYLVARSGSPTGLGGGAAPPGGRPVSDRAIVLATLRNGEQVPEFIRALWTEDLVDHIELRPLTAAETGDLLREMLDGPVDSASVDRLWRLSAGNALLLRELVIAARTGGELTTAYGLWRWTGRLELAPSLTDLIDVRVGALTNEIRTVLELVAFGEPIGLRLLEQATDPASVELAEERGLIRVLREDRRTTVRLGHPLYGEVVRRGCPVTRRHRLLAHLADLVAKAGARRREDLLRVAVWRLDSDTAQDGQLLLDAAQYAFSSFDIPLAVRLASASVEAGGGYEAAELLATLLMFADQPEKALDVLETVHDELTNDLRRSRWLAVHSLLSYWGLNRLETRERLRAGAEEIADAGHRAWVTAFQAIMHLHGLESDEALRLAHSVLDRQAAAPASRALARSAIAHLQALRGQVLASARTVAAIDADAAQWRGDAPYFQVAVELARGTGLILAGNVAAVDVIVAAEYAGLADAGDFRLGSGYLTLLRAQAGRMRGQLSQALRCGLQASAILATSTPFASLANAERAHVAALMGDRGHAVEALAESDRAYAESMAIFYPFREQARCWVQACTGDLPRAADGLRGLLERLRTDGFTGHEAHVLYDLVRLGYASETLTRFGELAGILEVDLVALFAKHARAAAAEDGPALLAVADELAARQLHLYAVEAAAMAVSSLRTTRSAARGAALEKLAALRADCPDAATPALRLRPPHLTERERQIARLAAAGVSSKRIGDELYLSARTVDNHLLRVYAKLGVGGRTELAAALAALPD